LEVAFLHRWFFICQNNVLDKVYLADAPEKYPILGNGQAIAVAERLAEKLKGAEWPTLVKSRP
jgi:hypothetical protein